MRKCPVCNTTISFIGERCPNCGYRYKPERDLNRPSKSKYMSQFEEHPYEIDKHTIKEHGPVEATSEENIFTKLSKEASRHIDFKPKRKSKVSGKKIGVGIVITYAILVIMALVIPIMVGIFSTFSDEFINIDFGNEYIYEWYSDYDELEDNFPEYALDVLPYRVFMKNYATIDFYEDYNVNEDGIDYAYISCPIDDECYLSVEQWAHDEPWIMTVTQSFSGNSNNLDIHMSDQFYALSGLKEVDMLSCIGEFKADLTEDNEEYYDEYEIEDVVVVFDYYYYEDGETYTLSISAYKEIVMD